MHLYHIRRTFVANPPTSTVLKPASIHRISTQIDPSSLEVSGKPYGAAIPTNIDRASAEHESGCAPASAVRPPTFTGNTPKLIGGLTVLVWSYELRAKSYELRAKSFETKCLRYIRHDNRTRDGAK